MSNKDFMEADEWFTSSPRICCICYALVPRQYEEQHLEWHANATAEEAHVPTEAEQAEIDAFQNGVYGAEPPEWWLNQAVTTEDKEHARAEARKILEAATPLIIAGHFRELNSKAIAQEIENPLPFRKDAQ